MDAADSHELACVPPEGFRSLIFKKLPLIRQAVRSIYVKMGIIREMPLDLQ
jgi:hypothetical protein